VPFRAGRLTIRPLPPDFSQVFILKGLKVLCFDTLLQVFILKVDSGMAGALAQFFASSTLLQAIFLGNVGGKGVRRLAGYVMGYYTIWLALVKGIFVPGDFCPVLGIGVGGKRVVAIRLS
jgi:hypothetical protein